MSSGDVVVKRRPYIILCTTMMFTCGYLVQAVPLVVGVLILSVSWIWRCVVHR
jgi:hypothetical protein